MRDVRDALMMARTSDGKLVRRPVSPHWQTYKWPLSMALSIGHRVTGVGASIGTILLTWWLVAAASSEAAFARVQWFLGSAIGLLMLFLWTAALVFHLLAGIRHLAWDAGYGFDNKVYNTTGWAVVIGTVVITLLIWIVGLAVW